jgi:hypothetical protein
MERQETFRRHACKHMQAIGAEGFATLVVRHFAGDMRAAIAWLHARFRGDTMADYRPISVGAAAVREERLKFDRRLTSPGAPGLVRVYWTGFSPAGFPRKVSERFLQLILRPQARLAQSDGPKRRTVALRASVGSTRARGEKGNSRRAAQLHR